MVHRSRAYFERCYAADFDPSIPRTERHACWVAWLDHYTSGQPRERIMYARERLVAQGTATDSLLLPGVDVAAPTSDAMRAAHAPTAPPDTALATSVAPVDTDTSAPTETPTQRPVPTIPPPRPPAVPHHGSPACAPICDPRFIECAERCDRSNPEPCRDACIAEHRACGNACL